MQVPAGHAYCLFRTEQVSGFGHSGGNLGYRRLMELSASLFREALWSVPLSHVILTPSSVGRWGVRRGVPPWALKPP